MVVIDEGQRHKTRRWHSFVHCSCPRGHVILNAQGWVLWTEMSLSIWKCLDRYMSSYLYPVTIANHRAHALAPIYHLTVISDVGFTVVKLKWFFSSTSFHSDSCVFLRCPWLRFWLYIPPFPFSVVVILVSTGLFGCYRKALQSLTFLCFILTHPYYIK